MPYGRWQVLSTRTGYGVERKRSRADGAVLCEVVACGALFLLVLYFFDLTDVFAMPSSSVNRFVVFTAGATGIVLMLLNLTLAVRVLRGAWPWLLVVAWLAMTTWWAGYPDISRTRVLAFTLMCIAGLGVAVGFRSPQTMTTTLVVAFAIITFANVLALALPDSFTEIGVRGIHKHKNAAGFYASVATVVTAFAIPQIRSFAFRIVAVALIFPNVVFLMLTESKTSWVLVALAACLVPVYWLWVRGGSARQLYLILTVLAGTFVFAIGASGTKISKVGGAVFGDPTLTNRMAIWSAVQDVVAQSPWRGHGFGSIWDVGEEWNSLPGGEGYVFYNDADLINEAHNGYLDLMLNAGYVGLFLCWMVVIRALWLSLTLATSNILPPSCRWTFCMLHCILVVFVVHNLTESSIFFPSSHKTYFFIFLITQIERWKAEFDAVGEAWRRTARNAASHDASAIAAMPARAMGDR